MSGRRWAATTLAMGLVGLALWALSPDVAALQEAVTHPQRASDAAGPDAVVLAWATLLAWAIWAWGTLGLALTAASALPGLLGATARALLRAVLPHAARRAAAVALGVGLGVGVGAPVVATAATPHQPAATAPDWPSATGNPARAVPDWPTPAPAAGEHVVVRGDCLWDIAAARLSHDTGRAPSDPEIAVAVRSWWQANAAVIGPDPDLLLPGQVLRPPVA
ncbi:LysM peptidoglycan-binding domain-containing protein [Geodermatophilus sp. URMC 64]